jgi:hypothetical protein
MLWRKLSRTFQNFEISPDRAELLDRCFISSDYINIVADLLILF